MNGDMIIEHIERCSKCQEHENDYDWQEKHALDSYEGDEE